MEHCHNDPPLEQLAAKGSSIMFSLHHILVNNGHIIALLIVSLVAWLLAVHLHAPYLPERPVPRLACSERLLVSSRPSSSTADAPSSSIRRPVEDGNKVEDRPIQYGGAREVLTS